MGGNMVHKMKLVDFAFYSIKNNIKNIEIRLNDEKRQKINTGDIIEFQNINTMETIRVRVINLHKFKTFKELFSKFDNNRLGLSETDDYTIMDNFYSKEDQEKYDALGIEIELI